MTKSKFQMSQVTKVLAAAALMALAPAAFAASTWTTGNLGANCGDGTDGASVGCGTQTGVDVSVTAWSNSTGATATETATSTFQTARARNWGSDSGLGVCNDFEDCTKPEHTADNKYGTDFLLFKFSKAVNLEDVTLGWWASDRDISVLAYKGVTPNQNEPVVLGKKVGDFTASNGWISVNNYGTYGTTTSQSTGTSSDVSYVTTDKSTFSSWWIVSAYNIGYGGSQNLGNMADYVKVLSLSGSVAPNGKVPEPGSLALMGAALIGFVGSRRRKQQAV